MDQAKHSTQGEGAGPQGPYTALAQVDWAGAAPRAWEEGEDVHGPAAHARRLLPAHGTAQPRMP